MSSAIWALGICKIWTSSATLKIPTSMEAAIWMASSVSLAALAVTAFWSSVIRLTKSATAGSSFLKVWERSGLGWGAKVDVVLSYNSKIELWLFSGNLRCISWWIWYSIQYSERDNWKRFLSCKSDLVTVKTHQQGEISHDTVINKINVQAQR